ncbi:4-oxalocrotonate tautomerase [Nocardia brasiliensis]|uniref:4-oxalocrotonate tautomerase n=1 Tax=Nocardia brasiliensis TaxID=37326 RepID=UPI00189402F9|nr:4-oxalocrotonate tautomerase [Nocardia brasiliensis]MBF6546190.1 4-oxalocrotonate tautomerase [Nocardia brasiliensis]
MPLYNIACRVRPDAATHRAVAAAVTATHCEITGAPSEFVSVVLLHGHALRPGIELSVIAGVRGGGNRTPDLFARLERSMQTAIATAAGMAPSAVEITLIEFAASWIMEGGEVLPEPGEEGTRRTP